jgi:hypothetical protein
MTEKQKPEQKPWRPTVERQPQLNPFVSHQDPDGALENPAPLADEDEDDEVDDGKPIR